MQLAKYSIVFNFHNIVVFAILISKLVSTGSLHPSLIYLTIL